MKSINDRYFRSFRIIVLLLFTVVLLLQVTVEGTEARQRLVLKPSLKFKTLAKYEAECREPGIILDSDFVMMLAPKTKTKEAKIIFRYLVKAYDELYRIVGRDTEYKIMVYHFPEDNKHGWGGTSNCEIGYSYKNLELASQKEWQQYKVPHVSGYIEEMAHSFVHAAKVQFGWEMVGWSIGIQATKSVANNPIFLKDLKNTRKQQWLTFNRYKKGGCTFPKDVPANKCDRIHAYLLWKCQTRYGRNFWPDFFKEIKKEYNILRNAVKLVNPDKIRNKRYQVAVDCFDRLEGLDFKAMLKASNISLTADIKALHPEDIAWNHKLTSSDPKNNIVYEIHSTEEQNLWEYPVTKPVVDINSLPPLHKAVFGGHDGKTKKLIHEGAALNEKGPNGWTALHLAAIGGHRLLSEFLLKEGAEISVKDNSQRSAADLAEIFGHEGLAKFLRKKEEAF